MRANKNLPVHISFDVDALDPAYVSSTGTRVEEGLHPHEVRSILAESLIKSQLKSLDCVEFNQHIEGSDAEKSAHHVRECFRDFFPEEFPPENYE